MITDARFLSDELGGVRVVVTGASGQLGRYLRQALVARGAEVVGLGHRSAPGVDVIADLRDQHAIQDAFATAAPGLVYHAAAYTDVDGCERNQALAEEVNLRGSAHVAQAAKAIGAHLVAVSTDYVFGGDGEAPYEETARPVPISVYGRTKLAGEIAVLTANPGFAVVRTAWLYGGEGKHFPRTVLTVLRDRGSMEVVTDERGSPTFAGDLAQALVELGTSGAVGIFHLVNEGAASRFELAQAIAQAGGLNPARIKATTSKEFLARYPNPASRPADSSLANRRAAALGIVLRPWQDAISAYIPGLASEFDLAQSDLAIREGANQA